MSLSDGHYYQIFANFRFINSYRQSIRNLEKLTKDSAKAEESKKSAQARIGIAMGKTKQASSMPSIMTMKNAPIEDNMLVATWLEDPGNPQKPFEEKQLFFNNESLLSRENMNDHFSHDHKKTLLDKNIEFICKKGQSNAFN